MDNSNWRSPSQLVAIVDLIITSLMLLLTISPEAIDFGTSSNFLLRERQNVDLIYVVIISIILAIDLWAVVMLLRATKDGSDPVDAAKRARIYRNIHIALHFLSILSLFYLYGTVKITVGIVLREILIYVVYMFVQELDQLISMQGFNKLDNIVVKI